MLSINEDPCFCDDVYELIRANIKFGNKYLETYVLERMLSVLDVLCYKLYISGLE